MQPRGSARAAALVLVAVLANAMPLTAAQADGSCAPPGINGQCNPLGSILMDFQRDIKGDPVDLTAHITLHTNERERARSFLFSIRNTSVDGESSPVSLQLLKFATVHGDVSVTKTETPGPNEIDLWVDILDIPVEDPIDLTVRVFASRPGAFNLEVLVMPFDRAYHTLAFPDGTETSLFSFTLLAVNKATTGSPTSGTGVFGSNSLGNKLPGFEPWVFAIAAAAGLALARRPGASQGPARRRAGSTLRLFRRR